MPSLKVSEYLPEKTKVSAPGLQCKVVSLAVRRFGSDQKLADFLNTSRSRINDWKFERTRMDFGSLRKLCRMVGESIPEHVQAESHKRTALKVSEIQVSPELSWFIGIRDGDRDEDAYSLGIGTSDIEIAQEFVRVLCNLFGVKASDLWYQVKVPDRSRLERGGDCAAKLGCKANVKVKTPRERYKTEHMTVRYLNGAAKALVSNIEVDFERILLGADAYVQGAYVKGLIDSEGTVKESGRIVVVMRRVSMGRLKLASRILENLGMRHNFVDDKKNDLITLTIYPNRKILEFCMPVHRGKSWRLSTALGLEQEFHGNVYRPWVSRS